MNSTKEKLKNYFLIFLIGLSILQIAIYYNYQSKNKLGVFLEMIYESDKYNFKEDEFFRPDRIVVCRKFNENHKMIKKTSQEYYILWRDAKKYLKDVLDTEIYEEVVPFTYELWNNIIIRKSVMLEFDQDVHSNLISTFLGNSFSKDMELTKVKKVVMQPFENKDNIMTLYLTDGDRIFKVYSYITKDRLQKETYDKLLETIEQDNSYKNYSLIKEIYPDKDMAPFNINQDILLATDDESVENYNAYFCMLPILLDDITFNNNSDLEDLSKEVLGKEEDYYDIGMDLYGTIVFRNVKDIFRIYKDGLLEYKYLEKVQEDKNENIVEAFKKVTEFIANLKGLTEGADITLVKTEKNGKKGEGYKFTFDYKLDNIPVIINNYKSKVVPDVTLKNAIEIISTNNQVVSCFWLLRDFDTAKEDIEYKIGFEGLLDNLIEKYDVDKRILQIYNIYNAYVMNFSDEEILVPYFIVKSNCRIDLLDYYAVPLMGEDEEIELVTG